jgi:putative ABC transport system substrate-binding protein
MGFALGDPESEAQVHILRQRLAELGWVEGRNVQIDVLRGNGWVADQESLARQVVSTAPDVILVHGMAAAQELRKATRTIPIVFVNINDPIATGVISSLARPEANVTGFMAFEYSMAGKWLSLLKDMSPRLARVALLFHPEAAARYAPLYEQVAREAGEGLGLKITAVAVGDRFRIDPAITAMAGGDGGIVVLPDFSAGRYRLLPSSLMLKPRVPAIYYDRTFAMSSGLMSYGPNARVQFRDGANYVDRILRGAKPSDLPVQFATKFELVINRQTAHILGLTVPPTLLAIADEVIE